MLTDNEVKKKFDILANKLQAGLYEDVINESSILLKKRQHQVFFNLLSLAYQATGEFQKSADIMEKALKMNSNNPYFLNNMGVSQHKLENFFLAEKYFNRGLEIAPNYINILNNLGNLKKDLNFTNEAIEYYNKSLSIKKDIVETHLNIANCYQSIGNYEKSVEHLKEVLKLNPKFTIGDRLISSMKRYEKTDTHLNEMLTKIKKFDLNDEQLSNLYFGIGKAYEDLKDYSKSFENYKKGNLILKKLNPFDIRTEERNFKNIKKKFSIKSNINIPRNLRKIIFIVGMPRSGTSLVEQILSSHKNVYGGGELAILPNIIKKKISKEYDDFSLNDIPKIEQLFLECSNDYIDKIKILDPSKKDFTDKAPLNFRFIGYIKKIFPNSKIVHCKRDVVDIAWSNYKHYFHGSLPFSNDLADIAKYFKLYLDLMNFWNKDFTNDIYNIEYEKLVNEPKIEIENLLKFCDLEWDDQCMKHEENSRSIKTASATQARKPIYKSSIKSSNFFKDYLEELFENIKD